MSHYEQGELLAIELHANREQFCRDEGKAPNILALGRWDCRELAHYVGRVAGVTPRELIASARDGAEVLGAKVKVDGRILRMPGGLWWHRDRRN